MAEEPVVEKFESWGIVEVMGRQSYAGLIREVTIAGAGMIRIDVPECAGGIQGYTKFFAPGSLYGITPTDEATARRYVAAAAKPAVEPWLLKEQGQLRLSRPSMDEADLDEGF